MKKLSLIAIAISSMFFFSCKKDSATSTTTSDYYIKGKKDGVAFNFTSNAQAQTMSGSGFSIFSLIAGGGNTEGFNIGISSTNGNAIQTGTYQENATGNYTLSAVYNPNSTTFVYAAGIQTPSVKPLVLNIVSKTSTEVSGNFSGAFYKQNITTATMYSDYITITEGEFKLQIK